MSFPAASTSPSTLETYELLVSLLRRCPQTTEVLPGDASTWTHTQNPDNAKSEPSFAPFLFVEENLGVPQKILHRLYLHADSVFKSAHNCITTRPTIKIQRNSDPDASKARVLADSSSILLLVNPSYQTALNARKLLVRMHLIDLHTELRFTASLLSSRHCAKHAELWYHRQWLLGCAYDIKFPNASGVDSCCRPRFASQEELQRELELVSRACEFYPRNYFAWAHRLICTRSLLSDYLCGIDTVGFTVTFRKEIVGIKGWIDCHVADYSAIHYVLALSRAVLESGDAALRDLIVDEDLLDHAVSLVRDYPTHEALWLYIRGALAVLRLWQTRQAKKFIDDFVRPLARLQQSEDSGKIDLGKASQFATQFLDRNASYTFCQG